MPPCTLHQYRASRRPIPCLRGFSRRDGSRSACSKATKSRVFPPLASQADSPPHPARYFSTGLRVANA
eukprot:1544491-Rhodomonas_salina.3